MTFTSVLKVDSSITSEPVPEGEFLPDTGNLYPKFPEKLNKSAVEVWLFDAIAEDGSSAFTVSFFRDALAAPAGFRIGINASWADGTKWGSPLIFPESVVTSEGSDLGRGGVVGVWRTDKDNSKASFEVAPDLSTASVTFDAPGKITGTLTLKSLGYPSLLKTAREAAALPDVYWMRPIAMADATVDITFHSKTPEGEPTSRQMIISKEHGGFGGMDRSWVPVSWTKAVTDSVFLRAKAGPYLLQIMRLVGSSGENHPQGATASLHHDGKLLCAPQKVLEANDNAAGDEDTLVVEKLFDGDGVPAVIRHENVGYRLQFRSGGPNGQTWSFEARHDRAWYYRPMSPPGPNATGISGFVVSAKGGSTGSAESFQGWGYDGQVYNAD